MTQGTRSKKPANDDIELDLDAWLAKRGLVGEKRMKVGGQWFRFVKAATAGQLAAFAEARGKGELFQAMASLLVDPQELDELKAAFEVQRQPIEGKREQEYLVAIINFLVAGDAGESSAS